MINFWEETIEDLKFSGKTWDDVEFITDGTCEISKESFESIAKNFDYHGNDWGCLEIPLNLKIVGRDWWMERHEYDGKEWWEFKEKPTCPGSKKNLTGFSTEESFEPACKFST